MKKKPQQVYDELLVLRSQAADKEAFDELVKRWQERLWRYAYRLTGSEQAAWDMVQETWVTIVKGLSKLNDAATFPRWAFRVLNSRCMDWHRKKQVRSRHSNRIAEKVRTNPTSSNSGQDTVESVQIALESLSQPQQALVTLRYHEGFSVPEIGDILGIPTGTVKSQLHRTLGELRRIIGAKYDG
jgi:RNA polymerase sigma factor (sigma-70 family)